VDPSIGEVDPSIGSQFHRSDPNSIDRRCEKRPKTSRRVRIRDVRWTPFSRRHGFASRPRYTLAILPDNDLELLLVANLPLLERLGRAACRGTRMTAADVEDFLSEVKVKLVERDYAALRGFQGRCSMATWLALVVHRQLLDSRAHASGRFRPSAEAQRMGEAAVRLEVLVVRDHRPVEEAVEVLRREGVAMTRAEAERIAGQLPRRLPRAVAVPLDDVEADPAAPEADAATAHERAAVSRTISVTLREAIAGLAEQDQAILRMLFVAGMSVAEIARCLGLGQQVLYRRVRRLCAELREGLMAAGIDAERVRVVLGSPDADLELGLEAPSDRATGPSNETGARA
jgi:RNA polymerase sigma factor (sigma-70 family)